MGLKTAVPDVVVKATIERVGDIENGEYGPYRSVKFVGDFKPGQGGAKVAGELWRRIPCSTSDDMSVGMGIVCTYGANDKGGMSWSYALDPDQPQPKARPGNSSASNGRYSNGTAPGTRSAPAVGQPLDVVGQPGREHAINEELTARLQLMNRAMQAVTKSLITSYEALGEKGIVNKGEHVDFASLVDPMTRVVNTLLMGLHNKNEYFGISEERGE
jgi:hypothetical protein